MGDGMAAKVTAALSAAVTSSPTTVQSLCCCKASFFEHPKSVLLAIASRNRHQSRKEDTSFERKDITMRFGKTLASSIYEPWKDQYLDYAKLKRLLREERTKDDDKPWTEDDESRFCDEILNTQLGKVAAFQESTFQKLEQRANSVGDRLRDMAPQGDNNTDPAKFKEIEDELESITNEANQLKKYSALNYTGFLKIVKKHDRKRGNRYKVRPMLQINLSKRPFNSEQAYTPLINKLSIMYFIVRQNLEGKVDKGLANPGDGGSSSTGDIQLPPQNGEKYTAYKCETLKLFGGTKLTFPQFGSIQTTYSRSKHISSAAYLYWYTVKNLQTRSMPLKEILLSHRYILTIPSSTYTLKR